MTTCGSLLLTTLLATAAAPAAAQDMPAPPAPGAEHRLLTRDAGTWNASIQIFVPGAPPLVSTGVETNTIGCGGLCLISDFTGEFMPGSTFHGHGVTTWDPTKKKYVGSWTDSMSAGLGIGESSWDEATKSFTGTMAMPDATGTVNEGRSVVEYKADGTRVMTMYGPGPGGKEMPTMQITYTRKS